MSKGDRQYRSRFHHPAPQDLEASNSLSRVDPLSDVTLFSSRSSFVTVTSWLFSIVYRNLRENFETPRIIAGVAHTCPAQQADVETHLLLSQQPLAPTHGAQRKESMWPCERVSAYDKALPASPAPDYVVLETLASDGAALGKIAWRTACEDAV